MARAHVTRRIHDVAPRQMLDRIALVSAFVVGFLGSLALKHYGASPFLAAGFSVSVLIVYAVFTYYLTPLRLEPETIGDNTYYLGFLFTLTSLAYTLYNVAKTSNAGGNSAQLLPDVISGFGVALASTIMGVFLRVLLMQVRIDVVAREHEMRLELNEASRDFRTVLAQSITQMKAFATESVQHASERDERIRASTETLLRETRGQILAAATDYGDAIRQSVSKQSELAVGAIAEAVKDTARAALDSMAVSLSDLTRVSSDLSEANIGAAVELHAVLADMNQKGGIIRSATAGLADTITELTTSTHSSYRQVSTNVDSVSEGLTRSLLEAEMAISAATLRVVSAMNAAAAALTASSHTQRAVVTPLPPPVPTGNSVHDNSG